MKVDACELVTELQQPIKNLGTSILRILQGLEKGSDINDSYRAPFNMYICGWCHAPLITWNHGAPPFLDRSNHSKTCRLKKVLETMENLFQTDDVEVELRKFIQIMKENWS